jgi:SagB-type dehydrogenase family enzyme
VTLRGSHPAAWAFHRQTSRWPFNLHGLNVQTFETAAFKEDLDAECIDLGPVVEPETGLGEILRRRGSCRRFAGEPLALRELGSLLHWAYGCLDVIELQHEFCVRPVPSGGGLYPLELYVLAQNVSELGGGVYHYVPLGHRLETVRPDPLPSMLTAELFLGQPYLIEAAAIVVITAVVERSLWKYEDRGYRYILLESGHVAANLDLCADAFGLATLNLGGFLDEDVTSLLNLDPEHEIVLYGVAVGAAASTTPAERRFPPAEDETFRRF